MYAIEDDLLMVASDRISAYDVVLPTPIPDKGAVLTRMSVFWFETTGEICPNHMVTDEVPEEVAGRGLRVKRLEMYPVECVVRGYLSGSGWREYRESGSVCGIELPAGLTESAKLPEPIFTPATKAEVGDHDENISFERAVEVIGDRGLMESLRDTSIALYEHAATHAAGRGIIIADTKFEFGASPGAEVVLADEVLTPDSSRFWPADDYEAGPLAGVVRQAVRARLARRVRLGPLATGAGAARRRRGGHPRQVRRGLRANHRASFLKARVLIRPKEGILDPQGKAVERALPALGFEGIEHVRVGRMVELEAEDAAQLPDLCEKLLANPLIEDYEIVEVT